MATQTGSQAVERASALLGLIVESGAPRTFSSLVDELGLAKSTTSRLLQALERSRLVHRDRAGAFRPGFPPAYTLSRWNTATLKREWAAPGPDLATAIVMAVFGGAVLTHETFAAIAGRATHAVAATA